MNFCKILLNKKGLASPHLDSFLVLVGGWLGGGESDSAATRAAGLGVVRAERHVHVGLLDDRIRGLPVQRHERFRGSRLPPGSAWLPRSRFDELLRGFECCMGTCASC